MDKIEQYGSAPGPVSRDPANEALLRASDAVAARAMRGYRACRTCARCEWTRFAAVSYLGDGQYVVAMSLMKSSFGRGASGSRHRRCMQLRWWVLGSRLPLDGPHLLFRTVRTRLPWHSRVLFVDRGITDVSDPLERCAFGCDRRKRRGIDLGFVGTGRKCALSLAFSSLYIPISLEACPDGRRVSVAARRVPGIIWT